MAEPTAPVVDPANPLQPPGGNGAPPPVVVPPVVVPPEPVRGVGQMTPEQLTQRLTETRNAERTRLLKELGFEKPEDLATFVKRAKTVEEANLTEQQKAAKALADAQAQASKVPALEARIASLAAREMAALPEAARAVVEEQAGSDPTKQLELIDLLRKAGLGNVGAAPPIAANGEPPPAPKPPLANAAPPANAPPPGTTRTKWDEYQALLKGTNPGAADTFYAIHQREIQRTRPATA